MKKNKINDGRFKKGFTPWNKGKKLPFPVWNKGNGFIHKASGYRIIYIDGKPKKEHRHIMEAYIGRKLLPFPLEVVHHLNGIRHDNRIENLQIMSQREHARFERMRCVRKDGHKTCSVCNKMLPYSSYGFNKRSIDQRNSQCRKCGNLQCRIWYRKKITHS